MSILLNLKHDRTYPALCVCINVFVIFGFARPNTSILRDDAQNILLPTQSYEMLWQCPRPWVIKLRLDPSKLCDSIKN